ncbi:MAG: LytTR family DNA-binding domain-containing protein, partial [Oscillospiraceae bacterium]
KAISEYKDDIKTFITSKNFDLKMDDTIQKFSEKQKVISTLFEKWQQAYNEFDLKEINEVLEKAIANLHKIDEFILVQTDTESERINLNNIIYIEAMLHNSIITCTDKKIPAKDSISKIDNDLNENFIKCHRSYTVNLRYIKSITKTDVIMDNGDIIPLSRRLYNEINNKFI